MTLIGMLFSYNIFRAKILKPRNIPLDLAIAYKNIILETILEGENDRCTEIFVVAQGTSISCKKEGENSYN